MNKKNIVALSALAYCLSMCAEVPEAEITPDSAKAELQAVPDQNTDCQACVMPEKITRKAEKQQQFQINPKKFPGYFESLKKFAVLLKNCAHNVNELRKTEEFAKIKSDLKEIVKIMKLFGPQIAAAKAQLFKASSTIDTNLQEITELRGVNIEVAPLINLVKSFNVFATLAIDTLDQFAQEVNNNKVLQELLA